MEFLPKLADVKLLRELSKVIVVPMLIAAYLIQSHFSIFGITIDVTASLPWQSLQFIMVFLLASLAVGFVAWAIHDLLLYLHFFTNFLGLSVLSTLFLAFGFLGVLGENVPVINNLEKMWFYASFVCGFYLLARAADIEQSFWQ